MIQSKLRNFNDKIITSLLMSKNYFGLLDFRNAKYQGVIREDRFDGVGILIDQQLTTVLTTWNKNIINGPSVIIFPSFHIFFGLIQQGSPLGVVTLQLNQKEKLLIRFHKDQKSAQIIPYQIACISQNKEITYIEKIQGKNDYQIIDNFYSPNEEQLIKNLTKFFQTEITKQHLHLNAYLKDKFVEQFEVFELSGSRQMFFGFKGTHSLGLKIQNNQPLAMGFWNSFPHNLIFGRKICHNQNYPQKTKIQQGIFEEESQIFSWTKGAKTPLQCIKATEQYFKKSTTFRNDFVNLNQVSKLYKKFTEAQQIVKELSSKRFGQALLQNNYGSLQQKTNELIPKEYTLQEVKQEIYKAAAKKHSAFKSTFKSPYEASFNRQVKYSHENSNRTLPSYRQRQVYYVNEFDLSHEQIRQPYYERSINLNEVSPGLTARNLKETTQNRIDLLKNVDEIIKKQRQDQQRLLSQLIKKEELQKLELYAKKNDFTSPVTNRYNRYEVRTNQRQVKYETKISPFKPQKKKRSQSKSFEENPVSGEEHEPYRYEKYRIRDSQTCKNRDVQSHINIFSANQSEQNQSKSHSNLAKYKERLREITPNKQANNRKADRYSYLNKAECLGEDEVRNTENLMKELKLFDKESQEKQGLVRSYSDFNNCQPRQQRLKYVPSQDRLNLRATNLSEQYSKRRKDNIQDTSLSNQEDKLVKMFSFEDRSLGGRVNQNQNPQILEFQKRAKRTFQYVE